MMHEKWRNCLPYLQDNVGKKSLEEMAQELDVSLSELKLFLHRKRMFPETNERNLAREIIAMKFVYPEYFTPTHRFFESTGIRQGRWWQLYKGERRMTEKEYKAIATHLKVSLEEAFEARQLTLFA